MAFTPAHEIPLDVRKYATAVHEAGHSLVAILFARRVSGARLWPPHGLSGITEFEPGLGVLLDYSIEADRRLAEDLIVVASAGQIAEGRYWSQLINLYNPKIDSHRHDDKEILYLMSGFGFDCKKDADIFLDHCKERARLMVTNESCALAINHIAERLCETMFLSRMELDEILLRHDVIDCKSTDRDPL